MKTVGIIAEYNPFHNGHLYQLQTAKEKTGADYVIVIMSGNFLQRGVPALIDKYARSRMALLNGADLVIELPVCYATGSAEYFAAGAVALLDKLHVVDDLCFGCETEDTALLGKAAAVLADEPEEVSELIKAALREGMTYPAARSRALTTYLEDPMLTGILEQPNNILALEYRKALYNRKSPIIPVPVRRIGAGYHDKSIGRPICSATAIREALNRGGTPADIRGQVPESVFEILEQEFKNTCPVCEDDFSSMLIYKLLMRKQAPLSEYQDISGDLSSRIQNERNRYKSFSSFADHIKTRQLTYTRVCRSLLHILLEIRKDDVADWVQNGWIGYAKVLGLRRSARELLSAIKENSGIPMVTKLSGARNQMDEIFYRMLEQDIWASDVYYTAVTDKYGKDFRGELNREISFEK
ncbi:nucleotidyltransferase [Diplocloster agilis]|uniref:nucleotidyltransferase n=1 Tax=Diplocloster agilis TaxID=2850323 RepID=UPI000820F774|nr:nucleotidyltransferase [Suonthocola fibrivorans]MCU6734209.1 nucleotidyltransferase [Suonthocola fibrivorans]SCJ28695.1 cytidyltransferase-like domain [uncultured Clostridium sp.]